MFSPVSKKGSSSILLALALAMGGSFYAASMWKQAHSKNQALIQSLKTFEGFYNSEISAWYNQEQYDPTVTLPDSQKQTRKPLPFNPYYPGRTVPSVGSEHVAPGLPSCKNAVSDYEPCVVPQKPYNKSYKEGQPLSFANTNAVLKLQSRLPRVLASTTLGVTNIQVLTPAVVNNEARFCGSSYAVDPKLGYKTCLARNTAAAPSPSPSASPDVSAFYRYLPTSLGLSMADKRQACRNLGAGWDLAVITVPEEVLAMREYLVKFGTPVNGTSAFSLPIVSNTCSTVSCMTFPNGLSPQVDCSGTKLLLNWPGVNDTCEPAAKKSGAKNCLFQDGEKEARFPILCEHNSGPYYGLPSCGTELNFPGK